MDFEHLYRTTYPKVHAYARLAASSEADADDAVAETYLTAFRRQADIPRGAELGWLIGVTRRVLANARRSERRVGALRTLLGIQPRVDAPDPVESIADAALRAALLELSPLDRGEGPTLHMTARDSVPSGDPLIGRVRVQIAAGNAAVRGREVHDGVDAWKITLTSGDGPPSVLWVRADDGKPLAIDDPGDPARDEAPEHARWTTYEVLDRDAAAVTLREAHPDARVVKDGARYRALVALTRR